MNKIDYTIRLEKPEDHRETENLIREAFGISTNRDALSILCCTVTGTEMILYLSWIL